MPGVHLIYRGMNVTFLTHRLSREGGGLQTSMLGLSTALNASGVKMSAIGITDKSLHEDQQNWAPTTVYATDLKGPTAFGYSPNMRTSLRAARAACGAPARIVDLCFGSGTTLVSQARHTAYHFTSQHARFRLDGHRHIKKENRHAIV